jgi:hypothetical protein
MVRQRERSPRGERLIGYAPGGHRKNITFVAALRQSGMTALALLKVQLKRTATPASSRKRNVIGRS